MRQRIRLGFAAGLVWALAPLASNAQETRAPGWARVSLFTNAAINTPAGGGSSSQLAELVTQAAIQSPVGEGNGTEYAVDVRHAGYPGAEGREPRVSVYDGYVAQRLAGGRLKVKAGQMWLNELGSLGSVGGVLVEGRTRKAETGGRWRAGAFTGLEQKILEPGFVSGVRKTGGYVAYDGATAQRNVVGFITVRNQTLTERSVLLTNNFMPLGPRVFVYQSAEYDLSGPGGRGPGGLAYFFANARITPGPKLELQATVHRGRSVDVRTITTDQLNGRPVAERALEGLLFESAGGRVTATLAPGVRLFGGYSRDRTNQDEVVTGRVTFGGWVSNPWKSGFDVTVSDSRTLRDNATAYDAWYVSVGHMAGPRAYVTADYTSSLSTLRVLGDSTLQIQSNPRTQRLSGSATMNLGRAFSLLFTVEHTRDPAYTENRVLAGLTWRTTLK